MIFCIAPVVSWALVFHDPAGDSVTMSPVAYQCFTVKIECDVAASAANSAFRLSFVQHEATCERQPAGDSNTLIPFGQTP